MGITARFARKGAEESAPVAVWENMTSFDIFSWCCLVFGVALGVLGIPGAIYMGIRAERRRKENAEPDFLDAVDTVIMAGADLAPRDVKRHYRNLDIR